MREGVTVGRTAAATRARIKGTRVYVSAVEPPFLGTGAGRRVKNWVASGGSINALLTGALDDLRRRSRDLTRKVAWGRNGVETLGANIVGLGIQPNSLAPDEGFRAAVQQLWLDWTDEADLDGRLDLYGLQDLAARSLVEAGEVLAVFDETGEDDGVVPLRLRLLEADHLPVEETEPAFGPDAGYCLNGVEFDARGRRTAYRLWPNHPGEMVMRTDRMMLERVPASDVLHLYRLERPGQVRGYPWIASALLGIRDLAEYEASELIRKKFAAMFTAFITTDAEKAPDNVIAANTTYDSEGNVLRSEAVLEPGTSQYLLPGENVAFSEPADVGQSYEAFMRTNLRAAAAAFGITYEQLTGDLTGVNFSSIRAGLNEFQRRAERWQHHVVAHQLCRPIWARFLRAAFLSGRLPVPAGYAEDPRPWRRVEWVAPGWRYVNPLQEAAADQMEMRSGTRSRRQVVASRGDSVERLDREIAADAARADRLGLVFDSDPRRTAGSGAVQGDPAQSPDSPERPPQQGPGATIIPLKRR
ncbi:MAG: phage portal protein [Alphaproteobacteria bacterium]